MSNQLNVKYALKPVFISTPTLAQSHPLLDSAERIFRSSPEKAQEILKKVKFNANKTKDDYAVVNADIILGNIKEALAYYTRSLKEAALAKSNSLITNAYTDNIVSSSKTGRLAQVYTQS